MKVLNVNTLIDVNMGGGTAQRTVEMSHYLYGRGTHCTVLTLNLGNLKKSISRMSGIEIVLLDCINKRFLIPNPFSLKLYKSVLRADIVHIMNHWSILNILVVLSCWLSKTPYVVCPAGSLKLFGRSILFKRVFHKIIGRRVLLKSSKCIAVTYDEVEVFKENGVHSEKITLIPNAINNISKDEFQDSKILESKELIGKKYLFYIGRLNKIKGTDLLVEAFCKIANTIDYDLVIAGPDEGLKADLLEVIDRHELTDRVHFIGFVDKREKFKLYESASLLVIPSRLEAMSIVVLEGGVIGTPVLLTDNCGLDYLEELGCAKLVSAEVNSIAEGIKSCLSDKDFMLESGKKLRSHILSTYTWDSISTKYLNTYKSILAGE